MAEPALSDYRAKRNFGATPEPSGEESADRDSRQPMGHTTALGAAYAL